MSVTTTISRIDMRYLHHKSKADLEVLCMQLMEINVKCKAEIERLRSNEGDGMNTKGQFYEQIDMALMNEQLRTEIERLRDGVYDLIVAVEASVEEEEPKVKCKYVLTQCRGILKGKNND